MPTRKQPDPQDPTTQSDPTDPPPITDPGRGPGYGGGGGIVEPGTEPKPSTQEGGETVG